MYKYYVDTSDNRNNQLHEDDIAGIKYLYEGGFKSAATQLNAEIVASPGSKSTLRFMTKFLLVLIYMALILQISF